MTDIICYAIGNLCNVRLQSGLTASAVRLCHERLPSQRGRGAGQNKGTKEGTAECVRPWKPDMVDEWGSTLFFFFFQ